MEHKAENHETTKYLTSVPRQGLPHLELGWGPFRKPIRASVGNVTITDTTDVNLMLRFEMG